MLNVWLLDHVTLFAADDSVLTRLLVPGKVPLEHFSLTAKVCAFERRVLTLSLVLLELSVGQHLSATFLSILARRANRAKLSLEQRMGIHEFERG